jgi:hypothetical protein
METTYTLRYRLSTYPELLKVLEFKSEKEAIEKALGLSYCQVRRRTTERPYQCYDITINWVTFNASEATAQLHAWEEDFQDYLNTLRF